MTTKICTKCGVDKDIEEFHVRSSSKDGRARICIQCHKIWLERVKKEKADGSFVSKKGKPRLTPEQRVARDLELKAYHVKYRKDNADIIHQHKKDAANLAKKEGIQAYGGKCSCCGESRFEFLTLEHINGRDKNVRKRTGKTAWLQLKAKRWPSGHTVLCFNCNCAKGAYGSCPHTWRKDNE